MPDTADRRLDRLEAMVAELAQQNQALQHDNAALRAEVRRSSAGEAMANGRIPVVDAPPVPLEGADSANPKVGRRQLLTKGLAAAGAAAAGAALLDGTPAAANDGNPVYLGGNNIAQSTTLWTHQSPSPNGFGLAISSNAQRAVSALAVGSAGIAGVFTATEPGGTGIELEAKKTHLRFVRSDGRIPPISDTVAHVRGEVVMDAYSNLWYCVGDGTPGKWRVLEGNGSTGAFFPFPGPVRVYDSRAGSAPATGPKTKVSTTRVIDLKLNGGIAAFANAVLLNVLLVGATAGNGNFTVWADAQAKPNANTLVWGGSTGRFSTMAFTNVTNGKIQVNASLPTDLVVDVIGQYY